MAWSLVGNTEYVAGTGPVTADYALPGGVAESDIVIVQVGTDRTNGSTITINTSGYTTEYTSGNDYSVFSKQLGASPETVVNLTTNAWGASGARNSAIMIQVWRGAASGTYNDASTTGASGSGTMANSPSITTVTAAALVVACGFNDDSNVEGSASAPSGYSNYNGQQVGDSDADSITLLIASREIASPGAEDPGAFGGGATTAWNACSIALKPLSTAHPAGPLGHPLHGPFGGPIHA